MAESIAVVLATDRAPVVRTVLDLLDAAVAMENETHAYFTGDAIVFVGRPGASHPDPVGDDLRAEVATRLRAMQSEGTVHVYACTRAMRAHGIDHDGLAAEVEMPAGFAFFLSVAEDAKLTFSF